MFTVEAFGAQPYELTFEERAGYLYVRIAATSISPAMAVSWINEVAERCAAIDCKRLLIERDVPTPPTGHALAAINDFVGMRDGRPVAFVNPHDGLVGDSLRIQIEAGATSGARVAYFTDVEAAEAWLLDGHPISDPSDEVRPLVVLNSA